jgi:hypothetical protein
MAKIKLVDWGLAARFGDVIEIHKDLKYYPKLYKPILEHEKSHEDCSSYTKKDFALDWNGSHTGKINRWDLFKFQIARPKTWISFLPFYYQSDKGFVIDWFKTILYSIIIVILLFELYMLISLLNFIKGGG